MENRFHLFEPDGDLWPLDALRPVSEIHCGAMTLRERFERLLGAEGRVVVREELRGVAAELGILSEKPEAGLYVVANAVLTEPIPLDGPEEAGYAGNRLVWARFGGDRAARFDRLRPDAAVAGLPRRETAAKFIDRPWDIVRHHEEILRSDCAALAAEAPARSSREFVSIDEAGGRVVIDPSAEVHPFTRIEGPCWIGPKALLKPHTHLRACAIGEGSRVGGEISGTIFFPYSNKQHAGFLGNSVVGSWVNIGAGATGSNLKNTYGEIRHESEATGLRYFGQVIGDHAKVAIMTAMNTGSVYGICANIFGGDGGFDSPVPKRIRDFAFGLDAGLVEDVLRTARIVLERRGRTLTPAMERLIRLRAESPRF